MSEEKHPLDIVPHLKKLTQDVLFGEVWEDQSLSKRDRSLVTCAVLASQYRTAELEFHLGFALQNGVKKEELLAMITHIAFYSGWPTAVNAGKVACQVFEEHDNAKSE